MENCDGTVITNYGEVGTFPNDDLAVGYIFDWNQILDNEGVGNYSIKVDFNIEGVNEIVKLSNQRKSSEKLIDELFGEDK